MKKSKIVKINTESEMRIFIEGEGIENVQEFCYLGSILEKSGSVEKELNTRINNAQNAFYMLNRTWRSSELSVQTKIRIFNTNVESKILHASETWSLDKRNAQ